MYLPASPQFAALSSAARRPWVRAAGAAAEFSRRAALAREPAPDGVASPSLRYLLGELSALAPRRTIPAAAHIARDPMPVLLLPGFGAHPLRMRRMRAALNAAGHDAHDWGMGFNLGPSAENFAFLLARAERLAQVAGRPIALVGWSLGGLFAREIARARPDSVAKVITMGTPFSGDRHANNAWRAYQLITGHTVDAPPIPCGFAEKPPVPTIALWSARDGVVSPRSACGRSGERDRAVALRCNHLGFAGDPAAISAVLGELDRAD